MSTSNAVYTLSGKQSNNVVPRMLISRPSEEVISQSVIQIHYKIEIYMHMSNICCYT